MASQNNRGVPTIAGALIRPHAPADAAPPADPADEHDQVEAEAQGREAKPTRTPRKRRPAPGGETRGRKLALPDGVYDRLQLLAIQRRTTCSAIAAEILDRNLPKLRIEREG